MSSAIDNGALKILLVSTSYPKDERDWQGRFIADMVQSLTQSGDATLNLWAPPGVKPQAVSDATSPEEATWLQNLAERGGIAHALRHNPISGIFQAIGLLKRLGQTYTRNGDIDVAHINWLQNALPLWGSKTPAVITVLGSDFGLLQLPGMKSLLRAVFKQRKCILAPNAEWMVPKLTDHFGDVAEIRAIPFGIEKSWFAINRMRREVPVSQWITVTRITQKKIGDLFDWGGGFFGTERRLHLFGPMQEKIQLPAWIEYHGPTNPTELQNQWFPIADGLISLSRHDEGRPQVMLEAMAAGLPIIASDLPAHRDLIQHRATGWIAQSRDSLDEALNFLENVESNERIGESARSWVKQHVGTWDDCAQRYIHSYRSVLSPSP